MTQFSAAKTYNDPARNNEAQAVGMPDQLRSQTNKKVGLCCIGSMRSVIGRPVTTRGTTARIRKNIRRAQTAGNPTQLIGLLWPDHVFNVSRLRRANRVDRRLVHLSTPELYTRSKRFAMPKRWFLPDIHCKLQTGIIQP